MGVFGCGSKTATASGEGPVVAQGCTDLRMQQWGPFDAAAGLVNQGDVPGAGRPRRRVRPGCDRGQSPGGETKPPSSVLGGLRQRAFAHFGGVLATIVSTGGRPSCADMSPPEHHHAARGLLRKARRHWKRCFL